MPVWANKEEWEMRIFKHFYFLLIGLVFSGALLACASNTQMDTMTDKKQDTMMDQKKDTMMDQKKGGMMEQKQDNMKDTKMEGSMK